MIIDNTENLLYYINKSNNFNCIKLNSTIEIFYNNKHLLYINIKEIKIIFYTNTDKENNRISILLNNNNFLSLYCKKINICM